MFWRLSRFSRLHNNLRTVFYKAAWMLPNSFKYTLGKSFRRRRLPYKLVAKGWIIVQVGCPWDILHAGRSRGIYWSLFTGSTGKVVIIEPDKQNIEKLRSFLKENSISNVTVVEKGAWSRKDTLRFLSSTDHPAANLVESVYDRSRSDKENFDVTEIEVESIDVILNSLHIDRVDMISITTNGSELEILKGMGNILAKTKYVSVVGGEKAVRDILEQAEFHDMGDDDRGSLYIKKSSS